MNIVITGGAGFIGANFIYYMLAKHPADYIICYDKLTYAGNMETLTKALTKEKFKFIRGDIADRQAVYKMFETEKPDIVVNFAAESHVDRSIDGPAAFIQTNVIGTFTLLEAARHYWSGLGEAQKQAFRFHHISTDEVYGDLPHPDEVSPSPLGEEGRGDALLPSPLVGEGLGMRGRWQRSDPSVWPVVGPRQGGLSVWPATWSG